VVVCLLAASWSASAGERSFTEKDGVVAMEAEHFTTQRGYSIVENSKASGGKAVRVGASGTLQFRITLKTAGKWYIWIRAYADGHTNNGLFLNLDGKALRAPKDHRHKGVRAIYLRKRVWSWKPEWQGRHSHAGPVTMEASAGQHVLTVLKRKTERPIIDKLVLTRAAEAPTGMGPAETPTGEEKKQGPGKPSGSAAKGGEK
jgi:hypothetical protein